MDMKNRESLYVAASLADAVDALADRGAAGAPLAGATWIMRAGLRQEKRDLAYVALTKIDELGQVAILDHQIRIGACVTHAQLAILLSGLPECRALAEAAGRSANPAIRQMATIGGNLCTVNFAAADLVPALICLDTRVELLTRKGTEEVSIEKFLALRAHLDPDCLVRSVVIPRKACRSAHIRLPLRKAGDYPVAIVSVAAELGSGNMVESARVAVGSVEPTARRWEELESALVGRRLDPGYAAELAERHTESFQGRDGIEASGWYRIKVLPSLVRRAFQTIERQV